MRSAGKIDLEPYLFHLRALPFVKGVTAKGSGVQGSQIEPETLLRLRTPKREYALWAEIKRTHLTRPLVENLLGQMRAFAERQWILLAPYVGAEIGHYLREKNANYLDTAGNCFLALDKTYMALVEGKRTERKAPLERGVRGPGHQVLFAILGSPDLLNAPVRILGEAAGVGKTAAAEMLTRLESEGLVGVDHAGRRLLRPQVVLDRWIAGYMTLVRPRLLMGRFRTKDADPERLEERIERELGETVTWAWGGGAAAMRLTRHYRGPETILHLGVHVPNLGKRLNAIPTNDGPLTVLGVPGRVAFEGLKPKTVHPLLIYTELLAAGHDRAQEAAEEIRKKHMIGPTR